MTHDEKELLAHAFAAWIKTVRGDELRYGRSTERSVSRGTTHREFWHPGMTENYEEVIENMVKNGFFTEGSNKTSAGVTVDGLAALKNCKKLKQVQNEFPQEDIQAAIDQINALQAQR